MEDRVEATRAADSSSFVFITNDRPPIETGSPSNQRGKKRPHHKSRHGCLTCKRRRVKCDEQFPCSNCLKRTERCLYSTTDIHSNNVNNRLSPRISQPSSHPVSDDTKVNLLHLELFYHFQRDIMNTLAFSEIWPHVLPWSFQEPYIMCTILCLAATHISTLRPQVPRYSRVALQLLGKSASLFREKLSNPVTAQNIEALIATSVLMHYISWSHVEFLEEQGQFSNYKGHDDLIMRLSQDPLFQLSSGVRGILSEAYPILCGSDSVFLSASLYSPRAAIEETILQHGDDPHRFVDYFMAIWDDPHCHPQLPEKRGETQEQLSAPPNLDISTDRGEVTDYTCTMAKLNYTCAAFQTWTHYPYNNRMSQEGRDLGLHIDVAGTELAPASPQPVATPQRMAFERIAKRLSLLFCLASISTSSGHLSSQRLMRLQPDIERCFFTFPVLCSVVFRELALQHDLRALVILHHFYQAARILLTSSTSWWARQRSHITESLILQDLTSRGLQMCILGGARDGEPN
ncbi:hypothetical protein F5Y00DRAFT_115762 [Daldinia vernicosa]|uniref:uncharacterized protein n=1 Tax=Daldinia vernicosa TaxID=114800 RepID=UPI0020086AAF|nr:uncharacterized protein F5Y00DRAFT_115762 [Daldinia vernicosa]KAI0847531.1 hypothetical protein F5Y00DRAFT_115762 [Daldinia vernicosa]